MAEQIPYKLPEIPEPPPVRGPAYATPGSVKVKAPKPTPDASEVMVRKIKKLLEADLAVNGKITRKTYTIVHKYNEEAGHRPYRVEIQTYEGAVDEKMMYFAVYAPNPPVQAERFRLSDLSVENLHE